MSIKEVKEDIKELYNHARVANEEMGIIKTDIKWIKEGLNSVNTKVWWILSIIVTSMLSGIVMRIMGYN